MHKINAAKRMQYALSASVLTLSLLIGTSSVALAQLPAAAESAALGQANPGRVDQQLLDDSGLREPSPRVNVRDTVLQNVPDNAEQITFKLNQIAFDGVGVYDLEDIQPIYADLLGTTVSLAEVYGVASSLTAKYRNDGYILTQVIVPPQTIEGGRVTLRAVEGFIDQIAVSGDDQESALSTVRAYANRIRSKGTLNVDQLEKFLLLINDLPGVEARSILSPSTTLTGASDLRIIVDRDPYDAFLGADNFGSKFLGPVQLTAAGALNSYFGNNERISFQYVNVPDNGELNFVSVGYEQPIGTAGTVISTRYSHANTEPTFDLDQFDVNGISRAFNVTVEHPFMRSRERSLYGYVGFDHRDVESRNILEATTIDRIRALRVGARYEFLDNFFRAGLNSLNIEFSQGLNVFGNSNEGSANLSRPAADTTFSKMNVEVQRLQRVTSNVNLLLGARGQLANAALLSSEEFGVGGINYGRAYDPSEIIGDDGFATKVELQWNQPYPVSYAEDYQLYSFYDFGKVFNDDATIPDSDDSLASVGLGVRADFAHDISSGVAIAWPLTRDVETQRDQGPRVYFNVNRSF